MLIQIVVIETIITMLSLVLFALFWPDLKRGFYLLVANKLAKGIVFIVGIDSRTRIYLRALTDKISINDGTYVADPEYVVTERGVPTLYFNEGSSHPIDMRARKKDINPQYLEAIIIRAEMMGAQGFLTDQKQMKIFVMVAMASSLVCALMVFDMSSKITEIQTTLNLISSLVSTPR